MKYSINRQNLYTTLILLLISSISIAREIKLNLNDSNVLNQVIDSQVKEQFEFNGLAAYLNQVQYYLIDAEEINHLDQAKQTIVLKKDQWFATVGRFQVLLIKSEGLQVLFDDKQQVSIKAEKQNIRSYIVSKPQLKQLSAELDQIRYYQLWKPFALLAKLSEAVLLFIKNTMALSWGVVILIFALIIKLLLLPLSLATTKSHKKVTAIGRQLQPRLQQIKSKYDGEQAHHKIMQAHKDLGVTPFYTLKPMLSFLIQIPVLIAIFNALGEMPQLAGQTFLWINDLSLVDGIYPLNFGIPFMGDSINLMPFIMTAITLLSSFLLKDNQASIQENKKQKIKLYLMSLGFLILFYPFPAVMVMYWAMANLLQLLQQKIFC
jgi:YidC/Oxa1 family membrane protein insertase